MNLKKWMRAGAALMLAACCMLLPVSAEAAISAAKASPVIAPETAVCAVTAGGSGTLAVTVTPDSGTPPDVFSSHGDAARAAYLRKDGNRYLYTVTGVKNGISTVFLRLSGGAEGSASVLVGEAAGTMNVRIPEGRNLRETAELLERAGVCSMKQFLEAANSPDLDAYAFISECAGRDRRYYKAEGYLFPDTYNLWKRQDALAVVKTMLDNYQAKTASVNWQNSYGMTRDQVMTFASVVQAEGTSYDLKNISSVFHNRLKDGPQKQIPRLQANSTTYYPFRAKANVPAQYGDYTSTYDTYSIAGLPAGPICSPGLQAIDAALHPSSTTYYFFCHGNGQAFFAETLTQHKQNLAAAGLRDPALDLAKAK